MSTKLSRLLTNQQHLGPDLTFCVLDSNGPYMDVLRNTDLGKFGSTEIVSIYPEAFFRENGVSGGTVRQIRGIPKLKGIPEFVITSTDCYMYTINGREHSDMFNDRKCELLKQVVDRITKISNLEGQ
ncbi:hypothetical protein [Neptuniibacter sp. QD37_11]|uniref:hypothetical protein n=1 Tax=Neptuniibacter sp. QD37_11 TaxID=3398209 RepID=UPI0039F5F3D8